jgi:hypothetical protein
LVAIITDSVIILETEDDAWQLLSDLIDKSRSFEVLPDISFGNWAKIDVYIPGAKYNSAMTPYMMQGWVEL